MRIGYAHVAKADDSQSLDLERDALGAEGIDEAANLYHDFASDVRDDRPGLEGCLRALRKGDVLVVWERDRSSTAPSAASTVERPPPEQVFSREDVERQIAIVAIVAMKESAFLVAIDGIVGGRQACVTIEDDGEK